MTLYDKNNNIIKPDPPPPGPENYYWKGFGPPYDPADKWWKRLWNWVFVEKEFRPKEGNYGQRA